MSNHFKKLDPIYNTELRIATESFHISSIKSILIEIGKPFLYSLKYAIRTMTSSNSIIFSGVYSNNRIKAETIQEAFHSIKELINIWKK